MLLSPLLPAGFYYKTFMWPRVFWRHVYEPAIRAAAGLGRAPTAADPDRYLHHYAHCDVLVDRCRPRRSRRRTRCIGRTVHASMLCDEQPELGGSLLARGEHRWQAARDWLETPWTQPQPT